MASCEEARALHRGLHRWVPPASFDGYRLVRPLGAGSMGLVYLGHDLFLDRPVAIKFIAAAEPDHRARERFLLEGRALARVIHPHVVLTFRVGEVEGRPFMVSEYVSGQSLDQIEQALPWQRVVEIGIGLSRGLAAVHRAGVLHRDVKPANVVVTADGTVKLIDFGLAKLIGPEDDAGPRPDAPRSVTALGATTESDCDRAWSATRHRAWRGAPIGDRALSRPGGVVGTRRYMAPERLAGADATRRSDVFSLGCVLHELCWGALPGEPLERRIPPAPADLRAILDRCLAHDPDERFTSADDVAGALVALAANRSTAARSARRQVWRLRLAMTAAVVLAAGVTARGLWSSRIRNDAARPAIARTAADRRGAARIHDAPGAPPIATGDDLPTCAASWLEPPRPFDDGFNACLRTARDDARDGPLSRSVEWTRARCAPADDLAQSDLRDARTSGSTLVCDTAPLR